MSGTVTPAGAVESEIQREAARVLRHLAKGRLERRPQSFACVARAGGRAKFTVSHEMTAIFRARGWVAAGEDGLLGLAPAGRAWLQASKGEAVTAFRDQHGDVAAGEGGVRIERSGSPIGFLKRHEIDGAAFLTPEEGEAADRLESDFERAQLRPRLTMDFGGVRVDGAGGGQGTASASAIDAKRRCLQALDAAGPGLGDLLFETICMARGLNEAERDFGWPARSAKAIVKIALGRLAHHYGLMSGRRRGGRIEAWREEAA
jgi:hypothetical protein